MHWVPQIFSVPGQVHVPAWQMEPGGHLVPQPPQLSCDRIRSTHCDCPLHIGQMHTLFPHVKLGAQRFPHAPQLFGSVVVSTHPPSQRRTHASTPASASAAASAVASAGASASRPASRPTMTSATATSSGTVVSIPDGASATATDVSTPASAIAESGSNPHRFAHADALRTSAGSRSANAGTRSARARGRIQLTLDVGTGAGAFLDITTRPSAILAHRHSRRSR